MEPSEYGTASIYWEDRWTATGERFHPYETNPARWTCASPTLPFNTVVEVSRGPVTIRCRVNDRGPRADLKRVLDLPPVAADALGITMKDGLGTVTVRRVEPGG